MGQERSDGGVETVQRYVIDNLVLDTGRQSLTRGGAEVRLPRLSFDLLVALVRAAPNVLSIEAIESAVWPGIVVSPETVTQRVKLLRQALGDDPQQPRYIAGVRGRGYRLVAAVRAVGLDTNSPATPGVAATARRIGKAAWFVVAIAVVATLGTALAWLQRRPVPAAETQSVAVVALPAQSVAVMPFENLSGKPEHDRLATGVAEGILHRLATQRDLIVIARTSSFATSNKGLDARATGQRLNARYLVNGSLQESRGRIRLTAQLIDAQTSDTIRSLAFDRRSEDLFEFSDEVSRQVAEALQVSLKGAPPQYSRFGADAYLAYLRGRALLATRQIDEVREAKSEFQKAIQLAPAFASAYAALAESMYLDVFVSNQVEAKEAALWRDVAPIVEKAIALDPANGEAYYMRARMKSAATPPDATLEDDFRRAVELSPNFAPGLEDYAEYLLAQEREAEGLAMIDRARILDPLDPRNHYVKAYFLWDYRGKEDEAVALYLQALRVDPEFYPAYLRLAQLRWQQGRLAEAVKLGEQAVALEPSAKWVRERLTWLYVDLGDITAAQDVMRGLPSPYRQLDALVCYRNGDVVRAADIVDDELQHVSFDAYGYGVWLAEGALVERAATRGSYQSAIKTLRSQPGLANDRGEIAYNAQTLFVLLHLASLERAAGRLEVAEGIDKGILLVLDRRAGLGRPGSSALLRALVNAQLGREDEAMTDLESVATGAARMGAWALYGQAPFFGSLRDNPRFQVLADSASSWIESERREVERLRREGLIPRRTGIPGANCSSR